MANHTPVAVWVPFESLILPCRISPMSFPYGESAAFRTPSEIQIEASWMCICVVGAETKRGENRSPVQSKPLSTNNLAFSYDSTVSLH